MTDEIQRGGIFPPPQRLLFVATQRVAASWAGQVVRRYKNGDVAG